MMVYSYGDGANNTWRRRNQPVQEFVDNNFALDRKIKEEACRGLMPECQWLIKLGVESDELPAGFILQWSDHGDGAMMSPNRKGGHMSHRLCISLSRYVKSVRNGGRVYKSFKEIAR
jgi:hypothetical protein